MPELHLVLFPTGRQVKTAPTALVITQFPCVLGRAVTCDECIDDLMVSRCHCVFSLHDGQVQVEDLGSRNGTGLNGDRLAGAQPIADGDALQVAHLVFHVRIQKAPAPTKAPGTAPRPEHELVAHDAAANS